MKANKITYFASTAALPLALGLAACAQESDSRFDEGRPALADPSQVGAIEFRLTDSSKLAIRELQIEVANSAGQRIYSDVVALSSTTQSTSFLLAFPAGLGYSMTLRAEDEKGTLCTGSALFNIVARQTLQLPLTLRCGPTSEPSNNGNVKVEIGVESVQRECPEITMMAAMPDGSNIGRSIRLGASASQSGVRYAWSASSGTFSDPSKADTQFRCEENGPVTVTLAVQTSPECKKEHSMELVCQLDGGGQSDCEEIVAACRDKSTKDAETLQQCQEIGQSGDESRCSAERQRCVALCQGAAATKQKVEIRFEAQVGSETFDCRKKYKKLGSTGDAEASPNDFRFFIHDIALVKADGSHSPLEVEDRGPWQGSGVALVDFEGGPAAGCYGGSEGTNLKVTGMVEPGSYLGLRFRTGVPSTLNHLDPATMQAPLSASGMFWSWMSGFKFIKAELGSHVLHVGSTGCGSSASVEIRCAKSNRSLIELEQFNPATDVIVADLAAIFSKSDLSQEQVCHSSGSDCNALFEAVGLNFQDGSVGESQRLFRIK